MLKSMSMLVFTLAVGCPLALAADAPQKKETKPAALTAEQSKELAKLVKQLGHEEWAEREEASAKIVKFGKAALPALKKAAESDDAEIASRAKELIEEIDPPKKPHAAADPNRAGPVIMLGAGGAQVLVARAVAVGGGPNVQVQIRTINGPDGKVVITETGDGVTITVTPKKQGAKAQTYKAKDRAEFKKKHAAVYMKYLATEAEKKAAAEEAKVAKDKNAAAAKSAPPKKVEAEK